MNKEAQRIWDDGHFVMAIEYYGFKISLYSVGHEFYEVYYHPDLNRIEEIRKATKADLAKYLNRIELSI